MAWTHLFSTVVEARDAAARQTRRWGPKLILRGRTRRGFRIKDRFSNGRDAKSDYPRADVIGTVWEDGSFTQVDPPDGRARPR